MNNTILSEKDAIIWGMYKDQMRRQYDNHIEMEKFEKLVLANKGEFEKIGPNLGTSLDNWDCFNSPVKKCVYNWDSNIGDDECVYCGQPDERK